MARFYWPGIWADVRRWCAACQLVNQPAIPRAPLRPLPLVKVPFERFGMDIIGLLFGRKPRGVVDLLKENWEEGPSPGKKEIQYVLDLRAKLHTLDRCVEQRAGGRFVPGGAGGRSPSFLHQPEAIGEGGALQHGRKGMPGHPVGGRLPAVLPPGTPVHPLLGSLGGILLYSRLTSR
ncbi:uncharacterized protein AB9W97_009667 isoform 2-T2 [Spinachia spinachia]